MQRHPEDQVSVNRRSEASEGLRAELGCVELAQAGERVGAAAAVGGGERGGVAGELLGRHRVVVHLVQVLHPCAPTRWSAADRASLCYCQSGGAGERSQLSQNRQQSDAELGCGSSASGRSQLFDGSASGCLTGFPTARGLHERGVEERVGGGHGEVK